MGRFFHLQVDADALTDELFAFVTDPRPRRSQWTVIGELEDFAPDMIPVLEHMCIDGVDQRHYVADYVDNVVGELTG